MGEITLGSVIAWVACSLTAGMVWYLFMRLGREEDKREALDKDFREHLASLPLNYVPQVRYADDLREIKEMLREMRDDQRDARKTKGARRAAAE